MDRTQPILRRFTPWILGVALVTLTAVASSRIWSLRQELANQTRSQLEADIRDRVETWEASLIDQLTQWADLAGNDPYGGETLQARMEARRNWFDSLYMWTPPREEKRGEVTTTFEGEFRFPRAGAAENSENLARVPCLVQARIQSGMDGISAIEAASLYRRLCRNQNLAIRTVALTEAMTLLLRANALDEAVLALQADGLPEEMSFREARSLGVAPFRAMVLRFERAELYEQMGLDEAAHNLLFRTGIEICSLDAPDAELLLKWSYLPIRQLGDHGEPEMASMLTDSCNRTKRRIQGFREVGNNLLTRRPPRDAQPPRFSHDQYSNSPYLLFMKWVRNNELGVALQLDQALLLDDFLSHMKRFRRQLVITDATGEVWVAGAEGTGPYPITVPFPKTLTHLRVSLRNEAVNARMSRLDKEWIVPALVVGLLLLMGFVALVEQVRASRQQRLLLKRQREFATRVTHELKTPLAGIKVMAENLEMGLFNGPEERVAMAMAIVQEADNLTERVNEILAVTKERKLRDPEPFDPEEPVFEAIDKWGPRLEQAGVQLEADLHPTDEVLGDSEAIRDAVSCLLDNALKYRREDAESRVWLHLEQEGSKIRIAVVDNGLGVPDSLRHAIFERFVRVEGDNRGRSGGHGLGLSQVAQILHGHRGRAYCEDGVDGGSRFVLELPALT